MITQLLYHISKCNYLGKWIDTIKPLLSFQRALHITCVEYKSTREKIYMAANGKKEAQNCKYFMVARGGKRLLIYEGATVKSRGANWTFLYKVVLSIHIQLYASYRWKNTEVWYVFAKKGNWQLKSPFLKHPQIVHVFFDLVGFCNVVTAIFPHLIPKT